MGMFDGMDKAEVGQSRCYFLPGEYLVQIKRVLYKDGRNGRFYIVECLILESEQADRPRGTMASWLQKMSGNASEVALGAIKGFLAACYGVDPNNKAAVGDIFTDAQGQDVSTAAAELSVSDENPMAGVVVRVRATQGQKKDGGAFTYHDWSPARPGDEALALQV